MGVADVFSEWDTYSTRRRLLDREVDLDALVGSSGVKLVSVTGIRRCGKSSLLMLIRQRLGARGERAAYVNLEDTRLSSSRDPLDDVLRWFGDEGVLLLDEVTAAPDYEGWLARNHELLKGRLRLIVSSSRRSLASPSKPLRGRVLGFDLYPLSFREFVSFKRVPVDWTTAGRGRLERALEEYLKFGGFPEVVLAEGDTEKVAILGSYLRDIVGLDVVEASGVSLPTVRAFSEYVLQAPLFSGSKATRHLVALGHKIGKDTALALEHYIESSYLVHFTHVYSRSIKDRAQYLRKAYPGDTGFVYALQGRVDMDRLLENVVLLELKRKCGPLSEINYWRGRGGAEVDFVVRDGGRVKEAIQVTLSLSEERTRRRELNGLAACASELGAERLSVLTMGEPGRESLGGVDIAVESLMSWLLRPLSGTSEGSS